MMKDSKLKAKLLTFCMAGGLGMMCECIMLSLYGASAITAIFMALATCVAVKYLVSDPIEELFVLMDAKSC